MLLFFGIIMYSCVLHVSQYIGFTQQSKRGNSSAPCVLVHAGQQVKVLGENYTLEDEEDSRVETVSFKLHRTRGSIWLELKAWLCSSPFHSQVKKVHSPNLLTLSLLSSKVHSPNLLKRKCISKAVRICIKIIFHLSKLWKAKFSLLCDVIFLVRLQRNFDIDHSQEWKG